MVKEIYGEGTDVVVDVAISTSVKNEKRTEPIMNRRCCYSNTVDGFLKETKDN